MLKTIVVATVSLLIAVFVGSTVLAQTPTTDTAPTVTPTPTSTAPEGAPQTGFGS